MTYDELMKLVIESRATDWVRVDEPISLTSIKVSGVDGSPDVWLEGHSHLAHLRQNLDISVAWGADNNNGEAWGGVWSDWSHFPDRTVHGRYIEVLWKGRPVHRQLLVSADGGRYYLPVPNPRKADDDAPVSYAIERDEIPLAKLAHELTNLSESFESGLHRTGATIV